MFILYSYTNGDDLIPSTKDAVCVSHDLELLKKLKEQRKVQRESWLEQYGNSLPEYAYGSIIQEEIIEEIEEVEDNAVLQS